MILSSLMNRLRSRTRVATFNFQDALGLKNRLRSRTRVTIVMFHDVWCFEESAPFSYMCGNFAIYGSLDISKYQ